MKKYNISVNGITYDVDVEEVKTSVSAPAAATAAAPVQAPAPKVSGSMGAKKVTAPMPGTVLSVKVNVGDRVESGTVVAILEAMKMENEILAEAEGVISSVNVSEGTSVNNGDVIVSIN